MVWAILSIEKEKKERYEAGGCECRKRRIYTAPNINHTASGSLEAVESVVSRDNRRINDVIETAQDYFDKVLSYGEHNDCSATATATATATTTLKKVIKTKN